MAAVKSVSRVIRIEECGTGLHVVAGACVGENKTAIKERQSSPVKNVRLDMPSSAKVALPWESVEELEKSFVGYLC